MDAKGRFTKGDPRAGRPKGTLNKGTREIQAAARAFVEDPQGQRKLLELYRRGKLHQAVLQMLHHYAYGKPKETVELSGTDGGPLSLIQRVIVDGPGTSD